MMFDLAKYDRGTLLWVMNQIVLVRRRDDHEARFWCDLTNEISKIIDEKIAPRKR